jgi:hypothetical protein
MGGERLVIAGITMSANQMLNGSLYSSGMAPGNSWDTTFIT